jgi:hypothetical protein
MRELNRSIRALSLLLAVGTGCLRRVETLEPAPCSPPEPSYGHSAIAWTTLAPQAGTVYGRVLQTDNGEAPAATLVRLWPDSTTHYVNADGTFHLAAPDSGTRTLEVLAIGFERAIATVEVRPSAGTRVLVAMSPALISFDECGIVLTRVRHWHIGFP